MAQSFNCRVLFPKEKQSVFIKKTIKSLGLTHKKTAKLLKITPRTLTDWKREKYSISESALRKLSTLSRVKIPPSIKIVSQYWYVKKASKLGGQAHIKKYGRVNVDNKYRQRKWRQWWEKEGKFLPSNIDNQPKPISIPQRSEDLAEFMGIMIGDGGISDYQTTITLNKKDDEEYADYVWTLVKRLFGVIPGRQFDRSVVNIVVSRKKLVEFCKNMGLPIGNKIKQGLDIPVWIMENDNYARKCLRGMVDTDGSVVIHRYKVNGKQYCYRKLQFASQSPPLIKSAKIIFYRNKMKPRLDSRGHLRLDSVKETSRYFSIIGSSNPKHIRRYSGGVA